MKEKKVLMAAGFFFLLIIIACGFVYANNKGFSLKVFYNSSGKAVYYPVSEVENPEELRDTVINHKTDKNGPPETAKIGDIFPGKDGYERVIAISEDGAFVTEQIDLDEMSEK
ncbi:MAG: hypothetical protein Q4C91_20260 [Eubacteriales bacterium]|nr:hypothetical protein [Eubacteriales bacterium]